jgi:hypothetical protein
MGKKECRRLATCTPLILVGATALLLGLGRFGRCFSRLGRGFSRLGGLGLRRLLGLLAGSDEGDTSQGKTQEDVFHRNFTLTVRSENAKNEIQSFSPTAAARMSA